MQLSKPVILLGGGGHASVVVEILRLNKVEIIGVSDLSQQDKIIFEDIPVLDDDEIITKYKTNKVRLVNGIGPSTKSFNRQIINAKFIELGYEFLSAVHPSAIISKSAILEDGCQIMAGVIIQSRSTIGKNSVINTGATIDHDASIGEYCHVAPGAVICGSVFTGSNVFIGAGATVIENLSLGDKSLVAAGTTLRRNLLTEERYLGS
tara:strand:- start:1401 stop:2021 length:621 start_codon:yes stop_codon:yes gene_type:complete